MASSSSKYLSKLSGQHVLILGGTSGIGFCVAEASIEHGATATISGSNAGKLERALERLRAGYPDAPASQINGHACDLSKPELLETNLTALLSTAAAKFNHIVFTAGDSAGDTPIAGISPDAIQARGNVRFLGPLILAKLAPAYMVPGSGSSITLTSGANAYRPLPNWTLPAAYGMALEGMMRGLAVDLKPTRVNLVAPGAVQTELLRSVPPEMVRAYVERTLVGRVGRPEDTAEAYIYLMKDHYAIGNVIHTDGGKLLA